MIRARRTPPTTPADEPPVSRSSWTDGEASGSSEAEFGAREDFGWGWGSGILLEVISCVVVVVVVVVVGTLCVVAFAAFEVEVLMGKGNSAVVDRVVVGAGVGFRTFTWISPVRRAPDPRLPRKTYSSTSHLGVYIPQLLSFFTVCESVNYLSTSTFPPPPPDGTVSSSITSYPTSEASCFR